MSKKVMLFARDPGGANTVFPLVHPLKSKGYTVDLYGKDFALEIYRKFEIEGIDIISRVKKPDVKSLKEFLKIESPEIIITGTSADDFTDRYLWKSAEELGIPTIAILDHWVNYGIRFSEYSLAQYKCYEKDKKHMYQPARILVMDDFAKQQMAKEGIDSEKIVITGQPYFDYLNNKLGRVNRSDIEEFRKNLGCCYNDILITYASEPISKQYENAQYDLGYDEKTIFSELVKAANMLQCLNMHKVFIVTRLHPKESDESYLELVNKFSSENLKIIIDKNSSPRLLMEASEVICGMTSMFLLESVILGRPTLSIQIGLKHENRFILQRKGILHSILSNTGLIEELEGIILNKRLPKYKNDFYISAIDNVISCMEVMI